MGPSWNEPKSNRCSFLKGNHIIYRGSGEGVPACSCWEGCDRTVTYRNREDIGFWYSIPTSIGDVGKAKGDCESKWEAYERKKCGNYQSRRQRRESKRLRRTTAKYDVAHAHLVLRDRTELALQEMAELAISKSPPSLSVSRLRGVLGTYGPHMNINQQSLSTGGTLLVDCCRARHVTEWVILNCVQELIERQGASPNTPAIEATNAVLLRKKILHYQG